MPRARVELDRLLAPEVDKNELVRTLAYVTNAGDPNGTLVPEFIGQFCFDTTGSDWYMSIGVTNTTWALLSIGTLNATELAILDGLLVTTAEVNRAADVSTRNVAVTASTLTVTELEHDGKTIVLDRAAGIAVTLPAATGSGARYRFVVKTTFTGAASIKSVSGADIMIGRALMGNDTDNSVVAWPAIAANTFDTIDLFGTSNSTGGMAGQVIHIEDIAANLWEVNITGDAAGTEATPFQNTVA